MTITINLTPATLDQLKAEAQATGKDVETVAREAVEMVLGPMQWRTRGNSGKCLCLLDVGVEVVEGLRGWTKAPIIMLSVRDAEADKVRALDAGEQVPVDGRGRSPQTEGPVDMEPGAINVSNASHGWRLRSDSHWLVPARSRRPQ